MTAIIHKEPNWVYEAASCIASIYYPIDKNNDKERKDKLGMTKDELEVYFQKYKTYKESVMPQIMTVYNKYPDLEKYFQITNIDNLITTIAGFLTFSLDDPSSLNGNHEEIDKLLNKALVSLLDDHLITPKDTEIQIDNMASLLNYLEEVDFDDKTKLILINLYNNRYKVLEDMAELLKECIPILKENYYLIDEDLNKSICFATKYGDMENFFSKSLGFSLDIADNTEYYFSIFNFNQITMMESHDNRMISYIGIYIEDLVKLSKKNKFNNAQILSDLKAISDPTRLRIIGLLANKKMYLQEIAEALDLTPSTISHHIQILLNSMLVSITVDAINSRKIFYETNKEKVEDLGESIKNLVSNKLF